MPELVSRQAVHDELEATRAAFHRLVQDATPNDLRRGMYYPVRWDPFFKEFMTVADIYHYPTQHFDFHQRQLTLTGAPEKEP